MPETPAMLAEKLKSEGEKFNSFFGGLTDDQWNIEVYTEGTTWTLQNILSHFVTSERALVKLFEQIRHGGTGVTDDFSIDRYNASQQVKAKGLTPQELLAQYKLIRVETIKWILTLDEADVQKTGRHPFLGQTTLLEMIKMLYLHNQIHYRDVRKVLG